MLAVFLIPIVLCKTFEMTVDKNMLHNISTGLLKSDMVFLKELIINSIDANVKLSMAAKDDQVVVGRDIVVELKDDCLVVKDGGIGMNDKDLQDFIGKLGGSGSRESAECTGRFGMGFYSSFVVAHEARVVTRKWNEEKAYELVLEADSLKYEINDAERDDFGTTVILKLRDEFKKQINAEKISKWISSNLLDADINSLFSVYIAKEGADGKGGEMNKINFMPWSDSSDFEDLKIVYTKAFKNTGSLLHAEKVNFEIVQKSRTGTNVPVYFEAILFLPEVFDMRFFGIENKGEFHFFVSGMKINSPEIADFLLPFSGIIRSNTALTTSTREELLNKEDEKNLVSSVEKALAKIIEGLLGTEKRNKVISSYNAYVKSGALSHSKEKNKISKKLLELSAFETCEGSFKTLGEMCEDDRDELFYTDVSSRLVKMRGSVANPNFDNINVPFFFVSGLVDQQLVSAFKDVRKKTLRNLFSKEFKERELLGNPEFEEWANSFLGNMISGIEVSKRLKSTPFCLRVKENAVSSGFKQMMGENSLDSSPFRSMFFQLPILEYNPDCDEFRALSNLRDKDKEAAGNVLRAYISAISVVSACDIDDKVGAYISLTNLCKSLIGLPIVADDAKRVGDEKSKTSKPGDDMSKKEESISTEEESDDFGEPENVVADVTEVVENDMDKKTLDSDRGAVKEPEALDKDVLRDEL